MEETALEQKLKQMKWGKEGEGPNQMGHGGCRMSVWQSWIRHVCWMVEPTWEMKQELHPVVLWNVSKKP